VKGIVTKVGWRHTVLETNNWDTLIVPNATLLASTFTILGKRGGERVPHRMWVYFNVDFRFAPNDVIRVVDRALRSAPIEGVVPQPAPNCVCMNFAEQGRDSMGYYAARYWITSMKIDDPTNSRVRARIYSALKRAEIPLAVPAAHLWVESDSEERRERKRTTAHLQRRAALDALPFLTRCNEDDLEELAQHIDFVPFTAGEVVTTQGATAHYLYIILNGDAEVRVYVDDAYEVVATIEGPTYIGEMGLMTGTPRMATVVAKTDLECYRLGKKAFRSVLERHPDMVEELSDLLAARSIELHAAKEELLQEQEHSSIEAEKKRIVDSIRDFFAIG
jgi:CRP-like cAMP-binding protein